MLLTTKPATSISLRLHPAATSIAALRLELLPRAENGGSVFRKGGKPGILTLTATIRNAVGKIRTVNFRYASADHAEPRYASGFEMLGMQRGWKLATDHPEERRVSVWLPDTPIQLAQEETLLLTFPESGVGCVRASVSPFVPSAPDALTLSPTLRQTLDQSEAPATKTEALRLYLCGTDWDKEAFAQVKTAEADIEACRQGWTPVMVTAAWTPTPTRVLPRGNWQDESGAIVTPAVPAFLPGANPGAEPRQTRLDLANWIMAPNNPLTARVFMNRLWKQCFGNGLSAQVEDLGGQGEWPTHPELLDWLAVEFRGSGWNVKKMVKLIVTSATYRQSSNLRKELHDQDPQNRLLASQNPRRLEAEFIRDNALAIAGLLDLDIGGPPCKPYQPAGYYANIQFPDRNYIADIDEREYRRGLYMHRQRTFEQSLLAFLQQMRTAYHDRPQDAQSLIKVGNAPVDRTADPLELAAWTSVCRVLLNLNETITRY